MCFRRRALAVPCAVVIALILGTSAFAQDKEKKPKYTKDQQAEALGLLTLVDGVAAGQPAPNDVPFTFQNHFMRSREGKTFIPFTLAIEQGALTTPSVILYLRAVQRGQAAAAPAAGDDKKKNRPEYAWEDYYFVDVKPDPASKEPYRLTRSIGLNAGEYDLYVALKTNPLTAEGKKDKNAAPVKATVYKQALNVPDYNSTFTTSSIFVLQKIDDLTTPLTEQQIKEQPYTFGMMKLTPALANRFTKKEELSLIFLIYNSGLDATSKKPNVLVEYEFQKKGKEADKWDPFNRTSPQTFSAETLPPTVDFAVMNQLSAGQSVPLGSFAEGEYRCQIKVTDKVSNKTLTEFVNFTVGS